MEKLLYINDYGERLPDTLMGYPVYKNLSAYNGKYARDKVVIRVDLAQSICKSRFLEDEHLNLSQYLCNTIMAFTFKGDYKKLEEEMSECYRLIYREDEVFRRKMAELVYVKMRTASLPTSLHILIQSEYRRAYDDVMSKFYNCTKAIGFGKMYTSGTVIYFCITDSANNVLETNEHVEVVSSAKNWNGVIKISE